LNERLSQDKSIIQDSDNIDESGAAKEEPKKASEDSYRGVPLVNEFDKNDHNSIKAYAAEK